MCFAVQNDEHYLSYFELSGPVFMFLKNEGVNVGIETVDQQLGQEILSGANSVEAIIRVASKYGHKLRIRKQRGINSRPVSPPSLIVHTELENGEVISEFLFARSYVDDGLLCYEVRKQRAWRVIPHQKVEFFVDAELTKPESSWIAKGGVFCSAIFLGVFFAYSFRFARWIADWRQEVKKICIVFLSGFFVVSAVGCQPNNARPSNGGVLPPPAKFAEQETDFGQITDQEKIEFTVSCDVDKLCRVKNVMTSCGCLVVDPISAKYLFSEGDTIELRCTLHPKGQAGHRRRVIKLVLVDQNGKTSGITNDVLYNVRAVPVVRPARLALKRFIGDNDVPYSGDIEILIRRGKEEPRECLDLLRRNQWCQFDLVSSRSVVSGGAGATVTDRFNIQVTASRADQSRGVTFHFKNHHIKLPVEFIDVHPIEIETSSFFLGVVDSEKSNVSIELRNLSSKPVALKSICIGRQQVVGEQTISGNERKSISFEIGLNGPTGRVEKRAVIRYGDHNLPPSEIVIAWINKK